MARLKSRDISNMNKDEIEKKLKELRMELVKARASTLKGGTSRVREIRRTIARILTLNKSGRIKNK